MKDTEIPWLHRNPIARLYFQEWKFCDCGNPEELIELVRDALAAIEARTESWHAGDKDFGSRAKIDYEAIDREIIRPVFGDDRRTWLLWYWLDAVGLTEHGGGVGGSWLTEKGGRVLAMLKDPALEGWDDQDNYEMTRLVPFAGTPEVDQLLPLEDASA